MRRLLVLLVFAGCTTFSAPGHDGPKSNHFDGEAFFNPNPDTKPASALSIIGWILTRDPEPWPEWQELPVGPKPVERVGLGELRVTVVGHATLLVQMDGLNILTDPVWSRDIGPAGFELQSRVRAPAIRFEDLPPIDIVLVSHNHYDHLDVPTLRRLAEAHAPRVAAGLGTAALLAEHGIRNVRDFDWWEAHPLSRQVRLTSVPVQHFSRRGLLDGNTTLWTGFVIEGPAGRVYFGGDTGYGAHFAEARRRLGPMRLAILPIGAYRPRALMHAIHIDPEEAVRAHLDLDATTSVGMHYGTFPQADDGIDEPLEALRAAKTKLGVEAFRTLTFGEPYDAPR